MATTALARRFRVDVTTDLTLAGGWLQLPGMTDFNPQIVPNKVDSTTYDTNGWSSMEITMNAWSLSIKALRQPSAGVYPPAQEQLRACQGMFGNAARNGVRWYDKVGAPEAWQGVAIVEWNESKTAAADLNEVGVTLTGDGILTAITNPYAAAAIPVVTAASPAAQSVGKPLTISGAGFVGTTAITINAVAVGAGNFTVVSDNTIVAVMPAGSAGSAPIIVTNAAGASAPLPYVRGA